MHRGDSATFGVSVLDTAKVPVNITGATVRFTAKYRVSDLDSAALIQRVGVITNATLGQAEIRLLPADTSALTGTTTLHYDVELTDATAKVQTISAGLLLVKADVRRGT